MSDVWDGTMARVLDAIESDTKRTLANIKMNQPTVALDTNFRKNFLDMLNNRACETFERYMLRSVSSTIRAVGSIDNINGPNSTTNEDEIVSMEYDEDSDHNITSITQEKKQNSNQNSGVIVPASLRGLFYSCDICFDQTRSVQIFNSIENVYQHWVSSHSHKKPMKPFQFNISRMVKCFHCDHTGYYHQLKAHHREMHSMHQTFGVVSLSDSNVCATCDMKLGHDMLNHMKELHKIIGQTESFDPFCLSDEILNELMKIDMRSHHRHHINADSTVSSILCPHCSESLQSNNYMDHLKSHSNKLKCISCNFNSTDFVEMVEHDKKMHHEPDSLKKACEKLKDSLKKSYFETKVVFDNGLTLIKHNLLGTKLNDSLEYGQVLKEFIKNKKAECRNKNSK